MKWAEYPLPWKLLWLLPERIQPKVVRITYARYFCKWLMVSEGDDVILAYKMVKLMTDDLR